MAVKDVTIAILNACKEIVADENFIKFFCGTYADGKPRNIRDAIDGEFLSPSQKKKAISKKSKKKNTKFKL